MAANQQKTFPPSALCELQDVQLEILDACATVCDKLGIDSWFIDCGTLLGAVRHGGFIPWDDDIDIGMKAADYQRFVERAPELLPGEFGIYTHHDTPNYPPLWAKVYKRGTRFISESMRDADFEQGIFIDVFAYLQLDSDPRVAAKQVKYVTFWQRMSYLYHIGRPKIRGHVPFGFVTKPLLELGCVAAHGAVRAAYSPQSIERNFNKVFSMGNGRGKWVDVFYPSDGQHVTDDIYPVKPIRFGAREYPAPANLDAYLSAMYGDYMQLPPEDKRVPDAPVMLDFGDGRNAMEREE